MGSQGRITAGSSAQKVSGYHPRRAARIAWLLPLCVALAGWFVAPLWSGLAGGSGLAGVPGVAGGPGVAGELGAAGAAGQASAARAMAVLALRLGAVAGALAGGLTAFGIGSWTAYACRRAGSAFLAPMAFGFLAKVCVLSLGTLAFYLSLARGSHLAFAVAFVFSAVGWQLVFAPSLRSSGATKGDSLTATG